MRIAYVTETYPPELNGVSLTVAHTVDHLRERGHALQLIRPQQRGEGGRDDALEWRTAGYPIPVYPELRFGVARREALRLRLERSGAELVHLATPGPLAWAALAAARSLGLAVTSDFRTNFHHYSRYYRFGLLAPLLLGGLRRFHNRSQRTFVPTEATRRELAARGFDNLAVVGRGVDAKRFTPARRSTELRSRWRAGAAPVLLTVGRVAAEKNVELALRAFEAVRKSHPDVRLIVVGDGPLRQRLEATHPDARFVGVQRGEALAVTYASADLFLFPSLSDTFGNVTLEALASGLPVVAFDVAAAAEHVVDRQSGVLVVPGDESAFIEAVRSLANAPESLAPMRDAARVAGCAARWDEVLGRFENGLRTSIETLHGGASRVAALA